MTGESKLVFNGLKLFLDGKSPIDRFQTVVTVRSEAKGEALLAAYPNVSRDKLSYVIVDDIAKDGAFDDAVKSDPPFKFVIHAASPYHFNIQDPVRDFHDPALKGTTGILNSIKAYAPSVERVVVTSSSATILNVGAHAKVYNETMRSTTTREQALDPRLAYRASKIYAEQAAWDFIEIEKPNFDLVTINPPLVFGPVPRHISGIDQVNTSNRRILDIIRGKAKEIIPPTGPVFIWTDVRDVASAHFQAMRLPQASGQRFFVVGGYFSNKEIADVIRSAHPEFAPWLPSEDSENDMPADVYGFDNTKSRIILGLSYGDLKSCISDTVESLMKLEGLEHQ